MEDSDDINNFVPSLLNPRAVRRSSDQNLSQLSTSSRLSLSLKKRSRPVLRDISQNVFLAPAQNRKLINSNNNMATRMLKHDARLQKNIVTTQIPLNTCKSFDFKPSSPNFNTSTEALMKPMNHSFSKLNKPECVECNYQVGVLPNINAIEDDYVTIDSSNNEIYSDERTFKSLNSNINCTEATTDITELEINGLNVNTCCTKHVEFSDTEEDIVISCRLKQKPVVESINTEPNLNSLVPHKRTKIDPASENSVILVLNKSTVKTYSHIVVQQPHCKFVKRKANQENNGALVDLSASTPHKSEIKLLRNYKKGYVSSKVDELDGLYSLDTPGRSCESVPLPCTGGDVNDTCNDVKLRMSREGNSSDGPDQLSVNKAASYFTGKEASAGRKPKASGSLPLTPPTRPRTVTRPVPSHKLVKGTSFAVDAFNFGDIPRVTTYFLTHFHSEHYAGLNKSFKSTIYCSKITADLCRSILGVNSQNIRIIDANEAHFIEGVEVTAMDANHCPGAIMLLFSLSSGKNILHCGDFRANYHMESHPAFWNKEIHTIYLDTTYCNPRYDFPPQDESIQMALTILEQKKKELEQKKKKYSSVLIVCGAYTIGKEKFFLGIAEREGLEVWAAPDKDRTLQLTQGRSFSREPPQRAQIHVLPMRDLTHQALKTHLNSMGGAFTEVVAFKPSGWEVRKTAPSTVDNITIHGVPYSEHSSFPELLRFVKFLQPKLVVATVDITTGFKTVQKHFPCPLVPKEEVVQPKSCFNAGKQTHQPAVT